MAYEKTLWEARDGSDLDRFEKTQETAKSVILRNAPNKITKPGTKFSIQNMNKIEQGIFDAHKMIASEETTREAAVGLLAKADELLDRMITAEGHSRLQADAALQALIDLIMGLIPNQADVSNLLADKNFVNSTVSNLAAWFLTPDSLGTHQWPSLDALRTGPWYSGGTPKQPTQNDYAIFINQDEELGSVNSVWRALFSNELWSPQYKVNDTPFTAAQLSAINSNITQALVNKLSNPDTAPSQNSAELITSGGVFAWFGAAVSTLKTVAKNVVGALNELFETKIDKSEKGTPSGVATLDVNGKVPTVQIPSVPVQINRTITMNDNTTGNVTDVGDDLNIPMSVTTVSPAASTTQVTAGTRSLRSLFKILIDNIAYLIAKIGNLPAYYIATYTQHQQIGISSLANDKRLGTVTLYALVIPTSLTPLPTVEGFWDALGQSQDQVVAGLDNVYGRQGNCYGGMPYKVTGMQGILSLEITPGLTTTPIKVVINMSNSTNRKVMCWSVFRFIQG